VPIVRRAVFLSVALLAGAYYFWCARATGHPFQWGYDLGGYYNYLARGFAGGHLYVPIEPSPKLLALPDPYAADVDDSLKMHDMAFYRGRYYLYHGAAPAVLLFTPWRLVTGHDVPENFALALFCLAGFLFSAGALLRLIALQRAAISPALLGVLLIALAVCQGVPFLLSRIWVYEIAIGCGYCCLSAAFFFLTRAIESSRARIWLAASGLMFGISIACRPHLGLAALIATGALAIWFGRKRRLGDMVPFIVPLAVAGLAIAVYNYQRFGNPFDFGVRYLLGNPILNRTELARRWVLPGLYYFVIIPPDFSPVFPWIRWPLRYPFHPAGQFLEPTAGCLFLAPFLIGILFVRGVRGAWMMFATAAAILLFVAGTGFTTQRYQVDFLPLAVLAAAAAFAVAIARRKGWQRVVLTVALVIPVAAGVLTSLALGLAGPYDELLKNRPQTYMGIARWFSPVARYRPLLNPAVDIEFRATCTPHDAGFRDPLLAMGQQTFREIVMLEHLAGKLRIIAESDSSSVAQEIENPGTRPLRFRIVYRPDIRQLAVTVDGREVLTHKLESLLTAPAQITVGANRIAPDASGPLFTGRLEQVRFGPPIGVQ
jgi:hypothetical protein